MWRSHSDGIIWSPLPVKQREWPITVPWQFHSVPRTPTSEPNRETHHCSLMIAQNPCQWTKERDPLLFHYDFTVCHEPLPINQIERHITVPWWMPRTPASELKRITYYCFLMISQYACSQEMAQLHSYKKQYFLLGAFCNPPIKFGMIFTTQW